MVETVRILLLVPNSSILLILLEQCILLLFWISPLYVIFHLLLPLQIKAANMLLIATNDFSCQHRRCNNKQCVKVGSNFQQNMFKKRERKSRGTLITSDYLLNLTKLSQFSPVYQINQVGMCVNSLNALFFQFKLEIPIRFIHFWLSMVHCCPFTLNRRFEENLRAKFCFCFFSHFLVRSSRAHKSNLNMRLKWYVQVICFGMSAIFRNYYNRIDHYRTFCHWKCDTPITTGFSFHHIDTTYCLWMIKSQQRNTTQLRSNFIK